MIEISEVTKRLRQTIARAKRAAAERRARLEAARNEYETFLSEVAVPVFRMFGMALRGEGRPFSVSTPQGKVRLVSEADAGDFLEIDLDVARQPPAAIGRAAHRRGREITTVERPIREDAAVADLTDEDVLRFLLEEIAPFVER
jgi:hypothetical protein